MNGQRLHLQSEDINSRQRAKVGAHRNNVGMSTKQPGQQCHQTECLPTVLHKMSSSRMLSQQAHIFDPVNII